MSASKSHRDKQISAQKKVDGLYNQIDRYMSERYHEIDLTQELNEKLFQQKVAKSRQERQNKFTTGNNQSSLIYNTATKDFIRP